MTQQPVTPHTEWDEKIASVMIYTTDALLWGDIVIKTGIRVSTWLRTQGVPRFVRIFNANRIRFAATGSARPLGVPELFLPSDEITAFHLKPPATDPVDYDPQEPNRKMVPVSAFVGWFRFNGLLRMSNVTDVDRYLDVAKEPYIPVYDLTITNLSVPNMAAIQTPYALVRSRDTSFANREQAPKGA